MVSTKIIIMLTVHLDQLCAFALSTVLHVITQRGKEKSTVFMPVLVNK